MASQRGFGSVRAVSHLHGRDGALPSPLGPGMLQFGQTSLSDWKMDVFPTLPTRKQGGSRAGFGQIEATGRNK